jgi:hypothetical protein
MQWMVVSTFSARRRISLFSDAGAAVTIVHVVGKPARAPEN